MRVIHEMSEIQKLGHDPELISERDCFVHNGSYFAAKIGVYENGKVYCWGWMSQEKFLKEATSGWITVEIPVGEELRVCDQDITISKVRSFIEQKEFIKEILDLINIAKDIPGTSSLCFKAYHDYCDNPSFFKKRALKKAYLAVPKHLRRFVLGDQDLKDGPIRSIIG